jgi:hypothetical protein
MESFYISKKDTILNGIIIKKNDVFYLTNVNGTFYYMKNGEHHFFTEEDIKSLIK